MLCKKRDCRTSKCALSCFPGQTASEADSLGLSESWLCLPDLKGARCTDQDVCFLNLELLDTLGPQDGIQSASSPGEKLGWEVPPEGKLSLVPWSQGHRQHRPGARVWAEFHSWRYALGSWEDQHGSQEKTKIWITLKGSKTGHTECSPVCSLMQ